MKIICEEEDTIQFRPYKIDEKIPESFQYDDQYQPLIDFFNISAKRCVKDLISKIFVMSVKGNKFVGYVAISLTSVEKKKLKAPKSRGIYDRPAILIGQLIIDKRHHGKGYGTTAIKFVVSIIRILSKYLPCRLLFVDAIDDQAIKFYKSLGFKQLVDDENTLVLDLLPILNSSKK